MTPSLAAPQLVGTQVSWSAKATDTGAGPLTFQFSVQHPGGLMAMARDYNLGNPGSGTWTSLPFVWSPTGIEGAYQIQVIAKDFGTGESAQMTVTYQVSPLVTGSSPVVVKTANPLVALFSSPACAVGSTFRVSFGIKGGKYSTLTPWIPCRAPNTMTVEIAGMRQNSTYDMFSQTQTGGKATDGPTVSFTTGALPGTVPFPNSKIIVAPGQRTDRTDSIILHNPTQLGGGPHYPDVATDLSGNILWYYYPSDVSHSDLLTRPLVGTFLAIENGPAWNPSSEQAQLLHEIDLAGNIVKETNTGILQHELLALGAADARPCNSFSSPAPVGSACLGGFHHDFIQSLPNGYSAVIASVEKIFQPGTQGDTSGLPVDIVGDMIIVLNANWQAVWYFDTFQHDGGGTQLDINRTAVLGETCIAGQGGCPPIFLLSTGIAKQAHDWLHANSLYYWPAPQNGTTKGDIIWSSRHQDWVMRIYYQDATGDGHLLWRMGPGGDFTFNNINNDIWEWFSHQHDVGIENGGAGPMTLFDNGNTRISPATGPHASTGPILGLGTACKPIDCDSRGMALTVDETTKTVTPVLSVDLGYYSEAIGSAQLLEDGNYFFLAGIVLKGTNAFSHCLEVHPPPASGAIKSALDLQSTEAYRSWQMPSMYAPPTT
jgi:arylsulfate sulfotransferase